MRKRILSFALAFVTLFLLASPAFAVDEVLGAVVDTVFLGEAGFFDGYLDALAKKSAVSGACSDSPAGEHSWFRVTVGVHDYEYKCLFCHQLLSDCVPSLSDSVSASDFAKGIQSAYSFSLPATGYSSNGTLLWCPTFSDVSLTQDTITLGDWCSSSSVFSVSWPFVLGASVENKNATYTFLEDGRTVSVSYYGSSSFSSLRPRSTDFMIVAPVSGTYSYVPEDATVSSGASYSVKGSGGSFSDRRYYAGTSKHVVAGDTFSSGHVDMGKVSVSYFYLQGFWTLPAFVIVPDTFSDDSGIIPQYYDASTRIGNYVGSYAVYNSDYGYSYVGGTSSVVNENDNRVWNPVTNTTNDYSGWTYDYSTRTYNFYNDDNSSTSTVTYGDENITIADTVIDGNGNTITNNYTVYYCNGTGFGESDPSPSPSPSLGPGTSSGCNHSYKTTVTSEPTCTMAGSQTLTCSLCGETKKEKLPATGHIWVVRQTVTTAYDEEGNLVQQGYSIYKCSVCGEEYKDVDGVGPPGSSDDDSGGGLFDWLIGGVGDLLGGLLGGIVDLVSALLGALLDGLISLLEMLLGKLGLVVEAILSVFNVLPSLFQGFLDLLTALFPFIPEEAMAVLTFGIIAVVLVAIIRLFL